MPGSIEPQEPSCTDDLTPLKFLATVSELCRGLSQVSATRPATGWRCRAAGPPGGLGPWLTEAAPMADS